jgi:hypothetical protein
MHTMSMVPSLVRANLWQQRLYKAAVFQLHINKHIVFDPSTASIKPSAHEHFTLAAHDACCGCGRRFSSSSCSVGARWSRRRFSDYITCPDRSYFRYRP